MSNLDELARSHISSDWGVPRGQTVTVVRKEYSFRMILEGRKSAFEECCDYAFVNPGTLRIEDDEGDPIWQVQ